MPDLLNISKNEQFTTLMNPLSWPVVFMPLSCSQQQTYFFGIRRLYRNCHCGHRGAMYVRCTRGLTKMMLMDYLTLSQHPIIPTFRPPIIPAPCDPNIQPSEIFRISLGSLGIRFCSGSYPFRSLIGSSSHCVCFSSIQPKLVIILALDILWNLIITHNNDNRVNNL